MDFHLSASSILSGDQASLVFGTRRDVGGLHLGTAKIFIPKNERSADWFTDSPSKSLKNVCDMHGVSG